MRYCLCNIFQFPIELHFFIPQDNVDFFILTIKVDDIFIWNFIMISLTQYSNTCFFRSRNFMPQIITSVNFSFSIGFIKKSIGCTLNRFIA